ncbi:hypothetical protein Celaphus_00018284 [Cervus elaphus hippelaphus]|uniref:Uncharacterized protein n=1 Tax=Cervus elaphus hippelaphus TaxID=46360 RepID=A0A212C5E5_CEREH|nr:hypothetical protein Celaphus_00018284 [Cervus elaphus hippelaphus]
MQHELRPLQSRCLRGLHRRTLRLARFTMRNDHEGCKLLKILPSCHLFHYCEDNGKEFRKGHFNLLRTPPMPLTAAVREPDVGLRRGFSVSGLFGVCARLRNMQT